MSVILLSAKPEDALEEFLSDPLLAVACVLLVVVSVAWIVVSRLIVHNIKRADRFGGVPGGTLESPRDIWTIPPG